MAQGEKLRGMGEPPSKAGLWGGAMLPEPDAAQRGGMMLWVG